MVEAVEQSYDVVSTLSSLLGLNGEKRWLPVGNKTAYEGRNLLFSLGSATTGTCKRRSAVPVLVYSTGNPVGKRTDVGELQKLRVR